MPPVAVVARKPQSISTDALSVVFDAVVKESHSLENEITDHPVEQGFNVTDHVRSKPERVTLTDCIVSNTPLSHAQQTRTVGSGSVAFSSSAPDTPQYNAGYAENAFKTLQALRDGKDVVTIDTTLRQYTSMAIETITIDRDASSVDALKFTLVAKRIVVVENKQTRVARDKRVGKKVDAGKPVTKPTPPEKSFAAKTADTGAKADNKVISGTAKFFGGVAQ